MHIIMFAILLHLSIDNYMTSVCLERKNAVGNASVEKEGTITFNLLEFIFFGEKIEQIKIILPEEDVPVKKEKGIPNKIWISEKKDNEKNKMNKDENMSVFRQFVICAYIVLFLILCLIKSAAIYYKNEEGIYILLGRALISKKEKVYYIKINEKMRSKSESLEFKLLFLNSFYRKEKGCDITILYDNLEVYDKIKKEILIYLCL